MTLAEQLKKFMDNAIIFLKGEEKQEQNRPLYTKEELFELYNIKKDIEKFPERDGE